ncbi:MAG: family 10 glycosylhydrolase [Chloroflexi bacterium]|nr:family 10 glycosylhydrolase [Chloroflexota bacterium]
MRDLRAALRGTLVVGVAALAACTGPTAGPQGATPGPPAAATQAPPTEQTRPTSPPTPAPTRTGGTPTPALARPTSAPTPVPTVPSTSGEPQLRGWWVDAFHDGFKTPQQVDRLLATARAANVNALFVQVRRRGDAYFVRSLEPRAEDPDLAQGFDPLQYLLDRAHQQPRVEVHAWLATFPIWREGRPAPAAPSHVFNRHGPTAQGRANWLSLNRQGQAFDGQNFSLDPGHPDALRYTVDVALDLVRQYLLDGLHFDYVRFADREWGYNPTSLERFQRLRGGGPNPPPDDPAWSQWRRDQVTAFVRQVSLRALALRPELKLSVAAIAWGEAPEDERDWARSAAMSRTYQDWRSWLEEGLVDLVVPMAYFRDDQPRARASFDGWARWSRTHRYGRQVALGVGALLNEVPATVDQVARALAPVRGQALDGVVLYSYASSAVADQPRADDLARALATASAPFARPARPPAMAWKAQPQRGAVMGEVRAQGQAVDGAEVRVRGPASAVTRTDGTGFYGVAGLPPGDYTVEAWRGGQLLAAAPATVQAGKVAEAALASAKS